MYDRRGGNPSGKEIGGLSYKWFSYLSRSLYHMLQGIRSPRCILYFREVGLLKNLLVTLY